MSNLVREKLEDYFSSMNPTSSRMMADIASLRQENESTWDNLNANEQSDMMWRSIVKPEVIEKYSNLKGDSIDVEYFPVLKTRPGARIITDEDASSGRHFGCTWRDEHSAPFRWETQSQLELHLSDDEENTEETSKKPLNTLQDPKPDPESTKPADAKKEDETKKPSILKRPEVPPPPVPPHYMPPVPVHAETLPLQLEKKTNCPIYAKVVKRKSSAKTLMISELKAHRKAKQEMKPAVPPRMSLELRGDMDITAFGEALDADGIPKTGFDFLDNW